MLLLTLAACAAWLAGGSPVFAADGGRYALVIGNGSYSRLEPLPNPARDASDLGGALTQAGFDVTYGIDVDIRDLLAVIQRFAAKSQNASAVVFYYAGHGFQLEGTNYIVPVDAALTDRNSILSETINLRSIVGMLQQDGRPTIVLLDACRNNPLPQSLRDAPDQQGLAQVETGRDLFVAFATAPGKTASSGLGRNSPFTQALLNHVRRPGLPISEMMVDVRKDVYMATDGKQLPWDQSSLRRQFYFVPTLSVIEQQAGGTATPPAEPVPMEAKVGGGPEAPAGAAQPAEKPADVDAAAAQAAAEAEAKAAAEAEAKAAAEAEAKAAAEAQAKAKADADAAARAKADAKAKAEAKKQIDAEKARKAAEQRAKQKAATQAAAKSATGKRPSALRYSYSLWRNGFIPEGTVQRRTPHGLLVCRTRYVGWSSDVENRTCSWQ